MGCIMDATVCCALLGIGFIGALFIRCVKRYAI